MNQSLEKSLTCQKMMMEMNLEKMKHKAPVLIGIFNGNYIIGDIQVLVIEIIVFNIIIYTVFIPQITVSEQLMILKYMT